ncbi:MAG: sporulation membrane protein YtaF [Bacillota bacterium]
MEFFWSLLLLAVAISLDGFGAGISYGLREIKLGFVHLLIIGGMSLVVISIAILLGSGFSVLLPPMLASRLGGILLIIVGLWMIYSAWRGLNMTVNIEQEQLLLCLNLKPLGIIIKILRQPLEADLDHSGHLSPVEAVLLGLALALDAVGVGFGAGLSGMASPVLPLIIGVVTPLFIQAGFVTGSFLGKTIPDLFTLVPGIFILCMGIINII